MHFRLRHRLWWLVAALAASLGVGGIAYATIPDQNGVIHGCRHDTSGALRVIDPESSACRPSETEIEWSVAGPQGEPGPPGEQGPKGPSSGFAQVRRSVQIPTAARGTVATLSLPEGNYVLNASLFVNNNTGASTAPVICNFTNPVGFYAMLLRPFFSGEISAGTLAFTGHAQLGSAQAVSVECINNAGPAGNATINTIEFTAVKVGSLSVQ